MKTDNGYPVTTLEEAVALGALYEKELEGGPLKSLLEHPEAGAYFNLRGSEPFDFDLLNEIAADFDIDRRGLDPKTEQKEVFLGAVRKIADSFPIEVLQDLDFWRYLSLFKFRNFVIVSSSDEFHGGLYGANENRIARWTLIEGLRWSYRLAEPGNPEDEFLFLLKNAHEDSGRSGKVRDMVISSVVDKQWARYPAAARAFMSAATIDPPIFDLDNKQQRHLTVGFNGLVSRHSNNVLFEFLEQEELTQQFADLRS